MTVSYDLPAWFVWIVNALAIGFLVIAASSSTMENWREYAVRNRLHDCADDTWPLWLVIAATLWLAIR